MQNAVVFLRGVDPSRARPWDHAPVAIELRQWRVHVIQGGLDSGCGFVRAGDAVEIVSRDPVFHALHLRGADFFAVSFPDANRPVRRTLSKPGVVELMSAAGYYWMRGHLFVDEHPYYTRTDAKGGFCFKNVPPGRYSVVAWMPNWTPAGKERDPDTAFVFRMSFRPPAEVARRLEIGPKETRDIGLTISAADFKP